MFFNWFDATKEKEFGKLLGELYLTKVLPKTPENSKKDMRKQKEEMEKILMKMAQYKKENNPNFYKTAQIGNAFKWTLREAGMESEITDELTAELMKIR